MDVSAALGDVLAALGAPGQLPDAAQFSTAVLQPDRAIEEADAAGPNGLTLQQRSRLHRQLAQLGPQLAALNTHSQSGDVQILMPPICGLLIGAARLANASGCGSREAQLFGAGVAVVLGSGRAVIERVRRSGRHVAAAQLAGIQLRAAYLVFNLANRTADPNHAAHALSTLFKVEPTAAWLAATTQALWTARHGTLAGAVDPDGDPSESLSSLASIAVVLLTPRTDNAFIGVQEAVLADAGLLQRLVGLLRKYGLAEVTAALAPAHAEGIPPGRQAPGSEDELQANAWYRLRYTIMALSAPVLEAEMVRQLEPPAELAALRQLAVRLSEQLPLARPDGVSADAFVNGWHAAAQLLNMHLMTVQFWRDQQQQDSQRAAALRAAAWDMVRLLPRHTALLRATTAPGAATLPFNLHGFLAYAGDIGPVDTMQQATQLASAADAALGLLPLLQGLFQQRQAADGQLPSPDMMLASASLQLWEALGDTLTGPRPWVASCPGEGVAAMAAARRLQLSSLRLLHFMASTADPAWVASLCKAGMHALYSACALVVHRAGVLVSQAQRAHPPDDELRTRERLQEAAFVAARWEAAHQAFSGMKAAVLDAEKEWVCRLAAELLESGSQVTTALLTEDRLQPLLMVVQRAVAGEHGDEALTLGQSLSMAPVSVHFMAALLSTGVMDSLLAVPTPSMLLRDPRSVATYLWDIKRALQLFCKQAAYIAGGIAAGADTAGSSSAASSSSSSGTTGAVCGSLRVQLQELTGKTNRHLQSFDRASLPEAAAVLRKRVLPSAVEAARMLLCYWQQPQQQAALQLELARAAATRSCAYLRCANLASGGGPFAGQGEGKLRCSGCKVARYCSSTCYQADWRAGHRRVCKALAAERQQEKAGRQGGQV